MNVLNRTSILSHLFVIVYDANCCRDLSMVLTDRCIIIVTVSSALLLPVYFSMPYFALLYCRFIVYYYYRSQ